MNPPREPGQRPRVLLTQPSARVVERTTIYEWCLRTVERSGIEPAGRDLLVLPELIDRRPVGEYEEAVSSLAIQLGCHVVGGSTSAELGAAPANQGAVASPRGEILARYGKLRPSAIETEKGVRPGAGPTALTLGTRSIGLFVCSDFWDSRLLLGMPDPVDLLVVTAMSGTRGPTQRARQLWEHLSVIRAFEFSSYVAVSDWWRASYEGLDSAGVAGLAVPHAELRFFEPLTDGAELACYELDFSALDALRADRRDRNFLQRFQQPRDHRRTR